MSEKLTYKTTTAIFIVTAYKHNSHLQPIKYVLSFIKEMQIVSSTVLAAEKYFVAARCITTGLWLQKTRAHSERFLPVELDLHQGGWKLSG